MDWVMLAWVAIGVAVVCALVIAVDEVRHPQAMGVMNVVWPVTALYFSVFAVWAYFALGRKSTRAAVQAMGEMKMDEEAHEKPTLAEVAVATSHCGAVES